MGFAIGANVFGGSIVHKVDFKRGKHMNPGTVVKVTDPANGATREFVSVKLSAATWLNGTALIINAGGGPETACVTASGEPASSQHARIGILTFSTATATSTASTTAYGWAQIYGEAKAFVSASVSTLGLQLAIGASGQLIAAVAQVSASGQTVGISLATATAAAGGLSKVFLNYPFFAGFPDANLA